MNMKIKVNSWSLFLPETGTREKRTEKDKTRQTPIKRTLGFLKNIVWQLVIVAYYTKFTAMQYQMWHYIIYM